MKQPRSVANLPSTDHPRLLILDDDPLVGSTVRLMAQSVGAESVFTSLTDQFFDLVRDWRPTHIMLDLVMPGLDGVGIIRQLGEIKCRAQLIIVSGVDNRVLDAAERSARQHHLLVAGALAKPFSKGALFTLLGASYGDAAMVAKAEGAGAADVSGSDLRSALEAGAIRPAFQPKVKCSDGSLLGFEALARWTQDGDTVCVPDVFVPLAEREGLLGKLTEVMTTQSVEWLAKCFPATNHTIAINFPRQCLSDDQTMEFISRACLKAGLRRELVTVEITESGSIDVHPNALDILTRARLMGFNLSLDDFGVGYSSLVQLARMPFSELKIDRRFVSDLCRSSESQAIVAAIIGMSTGLGMTTVAEGVEDLDTYMRLRELGCFAAQGFFIGRPMLPESAVAWTVSA